MRRAGVVLSVLILATAMGGDAFAKGGTKISPEEKKLAKQEQGQQQSPSSKPDRSQGAPLMRFHSGSHSKPDASWLHERRGKGP